GGIRLVGERVGQLKAIFHAASGELSEGVAIARRHIEGLQTPEVAWHRDAWLRSYRHAVARMYWMAGDSEGFMTELPHLLAPRTRAEWPFIDTAANVVRGLVAIFRGDWQSAASRLQEACDGHAHYRMSTVYVDPRISLAYVQLKLGQPEAAWRTFEPVYSEVVEQHEYGLLILDAREHVLAVLDALPAAVARSPETVYLRRRLDQWNPRSAGTSLPRHAGPLGALSEREREVLERVATGASNKQIARELALSLHTVKRHLANILDKLDCDSRGQAADMYRRSGR
ncbi:MAG TPA: LuxR C-terminal-related transcriptional regulator, partial [Steroidobacteraceae bacterium]|nr:LuxR C-terminal-related transcriptional regulator [Steroidobacteraceae bacterium]